MDVQLGAFDENKQQPKQQSIHSQNPMGNGDNPLPALSTTYYSTKNEFVHRAKYEEKCWNYNQELYMINYYRERPYLWHPRDSSFHATNFKRKALKTLSVKLATMGEPRSVEIIIKRFKNLRTVFLRECRRIILEKQIAEFPNLSRWQYFKPLFFLLDATKDENLMKFRFEFDSIERAVHSSVSSPTPALSPCASAIHVQVKEEYIEPKSDENEDSILPDLPHREVLQDMKTSSDPEIVQTTITSPSVEAVSIYPIRAVSYPAQILSPRPVSRKNDNTASLSADCNESGSWDPSPSLILRNRPPRSTCRPSCSSSCHASKSAALQACDKSVMTDSHVERSVNSDLEADLFGKQVTLHLQKMTPYNREMSKLLMQQVMSHFSLVQHDCHSHLLRLELESPPFSEDMFDEGGELGFVEAVNNVTANYSYQNRNYHVTDNGRSEGESDDSDEDIVTNYLPVESSAHNHIEEQPKVVQEEVHLVVQSEVSEALLDLRHQTEIPKISITPQSPQQQHKVLESNLQYVLHLREGIQKMRDSLGNGPKSVEARRRTLALLSASCPSLAENENDPWNDCFHPYSHEFGSRGVSLEDEDVQRLESLAISCSMNESNKGMRETSSESLDPGGGMLGTAQSLVKIFINDVTVSCSQESLDTSGTSASKSGVEKDVGQQPDGGRTAAQGLSTSDACDEEVCGTTDGSPWRRRSWLGLDQDDGGTNTSSQKSKIKRNLARTQRSMSLSSLDSDEDAFYDAHESLNTASSAMAIVDLAETSVATRREKPRSFSGGSSASCPPHSTGGCISKHSRSTTQLQSEDELDGGYRSPGGANSRKSPKPVDHHLPLPRNLHKSVSTPSILTVKDTAEAIIPAEQAKVHTSPLTIDDDQALSKPKKRTGSLFFRRKRKDKDKDTKKSTSSHRFVPVCYSNSTVCHVCSKSMANKPALRCENCLVNVHEHSCKDQISDCSRFRGPMINMRSFMPSPTLVVPKDRLVLHNLTPSGTTASPLPSGKENRKQNGGTPPKQTPTSSLTPSIPSVSSPSTTRRGYIPSGYSQWRRVATKLGVNKVINEEREADAGEDVFNKFGSIIDINSASMESLDEAVCMASGAAELTTMDDDPDLRLTEEEPEAWSATVDKKVLKKLKDKDIKRQETIYELIITEKHHCLTLKVMQKLFAQGMLRELGMRPDLVNKIFPRLEDIIEVHMAFLKRLRERQKKESVIENIADILLTQFRGETAYQMKSAYGAFCSQHKEAQSLYKDIYKQDRKFQNFIKKCSLWPLCKARGIPECILLVTQRITKYPLLIESLIKAFKDNKTEQESLKLANTYVKDILNDVNAQVAEKEREQRLLEIYNKIDAKSATLYKGKKFKKSDLLSSSRRLRHEATIGLRQARGKELEVTLVLLSDVIFFLQENNQKYSFVTQDNKAGVISLQKLLVREKAGQDNRGIYLISSHPSDPEMYELVCQTPKEKKMWMETIRRAVDLCPEEDEGLPSETEEERKVVEAKSARLRELTANLHEKDRELAVICEEKMRILGEMMEVVGKEEVMEPVQYLQLIEDPHEGPGTREMLLAAVHEASRLASALYVSGTNLSRSISSAGEHQSEAYVSPILPKRAETFGGFDNPNKDMLPKPVIIKKKPLDTAREPDAWVSDFGGLLSKNDQHTSSASDLDQKDNDAMLSVKSKEVRRASGPLPYRESLSPGSPESKSTTRRSTFGYLQLPLSTDENHLGSSGSVDADKDSSREMLNLPTPPLVTIGREQWTTTIQLSHYLNTLMCVFSQHFTSVEILKAELTKAYDEISKLHKESGRDKGDKKSLYRPNQQLEELRNLQEQLTQERTSWQKERDAQERSLEEKREELLRLQETLKSEKGDINEQRELLYRQLETLQRQGISLNPNLTVLLTGSHRSPEGGSGEKMSLSPPADSSGLISPSAHRRSMSCDLQLPNKDLPAGRGSSSATSSPTQTLESTKSKAELNKRPSASSLVSLLKKDSQQALPLNLYSATNQQKVPNQGMPVKQQLPLKLANLSGSTGKPGEGGVPSVAKYHSFSGSISANTSGLAHVLNTSPCLRGNGNGGPSSNPSRAFPQPSPASHAQSYLHTHVTQWVNPGDPAAPGTVNTKPPPSDRFRRPRDRDPDTNQEIIYF